MHSHMGSFHLTYRNCTMCGQMLPIIRYRYNVTDLFINKKSTLRIQRDISNFPSWFSISRVAFLRFFFFYYKLFIRLQFCSRKHIIINRSKCLHGIYEFFLGSEMFVSVKYCGCLTLF